ncbi:hypothetical protein [Dehalogenimonas etheniformans]|uniref:DUF2680 domain-containing protein n=1 Tax=Dehalogenimonas etheniformans TaxID=1536648 RepID=A0A2P5P823_9CHLR|nr:hypothetical protein [Dehalogenimonas etheniformans]PPD58440.1 hypothetical protein JP09_004150 [Dehalogenimonas etheniformans]QNT75876.1 hypothetical protein HX448_03825 [Dehalogenimonas etheniformans]
MKGISKKWLVVLAVAVVAIFAVGVPALAATGNPGPTLPAVNNGYGPGCVDSGTLARVATVLGLTPADLATQLQSGKTLGSIATEKNISSSAVVDAIIANFQARINLQVQNGYLTQTQAQTYLDAARQAAQNLLTLNLASVSGSNTWAGFCGEYLNASVGPGPFGPGMMGGWSYTSDTVTPGNPAAPGFGWGMMGGGWGCR